MVRCYFDLRDSEGLSVDEEGLELQDLEAIEDEAALSLADATRDGLRGPAGSVTQMIIEVRTDAGLFMRVKFAFDVAGRN